jgi:hypothetical protein
MVRRAERRVTPAIRWSALASGASAVSYTRSNTPGAVVVARMSPALNLSGATTSAYASTLFPVVSVAPGRSHGSFVEIGLWASDTSDGAMNDGRTCWARRSGAA